MNGEGSLTYVLVTGEAETKNFRSMYVSRTLRIVLMCSGCSMHGEFPLTYVLVTGGAETNIMCACVVACMVGCYSASEHY